jgi:hypothetical protein
VGYGIVEDLRIRDDVPHSAHAHILHASALRRGDWSVRVETETRVTGDARTLRVEASLRAFEGGTAGESESFVARFDERVPRDGF